MVGKCLGRTAGVGKTIGAKRIPNYGPANGNVALVSYFLGLGRTGGDALRAPCCGCPHQPILQLRLWCGVSLRKGLLQVYTHVSEAICSKKNRTARKIFWAHVQYDTAKRNLF